MGGPSLAVLCCTGLSQKRGQSSLFSMLAVAEIIIYLQRKAAGVWRAGLLKPLEPEVFHNGLQMPAPMKLAARVGVCSAMFGLCLIIFLAGPQFFPLGMGMYILYHCILEV